jgi:uncharacterized protein (DUF488 family)
LRLFTIGYGGRTQEQFLALLRPHSIRTVVDIRLRPDRASMGMWVKAKTADKGIEAWLTAAGYEYCSLIELGNLFLGRDDWPARYEQLLQTSGGLLTERLRELRGPLVLLCAERRVAECHRRHVAEYLQRTEGWDVVHLE